MADDRTEVAVRSGLFCAMYSPVGGRCAQSVRADDHHVVRRGEGGADTPDNRVLCCPRHHRQIHAQETPAMLRVQDTERGLWWYAEDMEDRGRRYLEQVVDLGGLDPLTAVGARALEWRGFRVWYLWPDVSEAVEERAWKRHAALSRSIAQARALTWEIAEAADDMRWGGLWALHGYDSWEEYLDSVAAEHGIRGETLRRYALAAGRLRNALPDAKERERAKKAPIRLWVQHGKRLESLPPRKLQEVVEQVEAGVPTTSIADSLREQTPKKPEEKVRVRATVRATMEFDVPTRKVEGRSAEDCVIERVSKISSVQSVQIERAHYASR